MEMIKKVIEKLFYVFFCLAVVTVTTAFLTKAKIKS